MYTLYWSPGSASMAPHSALEEAGARYELKLVSVDDGAHRDPAYLTLNPNGKVPTLVVDGTFVMFESAAMTMFVADRHPEAKLAPGPDELARGHFYQWLTHLTNSLQPAMLRYYYPDRTIAGGAEAVTAKATEEIAILWGRMDQHLKANGPYLLGERFSAADIFAYMLSTWQQCCPNTYERFPSLKRLADLVAARPAMQRVIQKNAA
ncbi:MAG TPA: glutathione S-transferase family protein [Dongiaceae bacterium]|jgi:glutathione S-transferase|nr:glutathione S-transferase family protein [Dongiaceae bacterium]